MTRMTSAYSGPFPTSPTPPVYPYRPAAAPFAVHPPVIPQVSAAQQRAQQAQRDLDAWQPFDLGWQLFHRARLLNILHAHEAWRLRYTWPLAAYGLAYLFRQPAAGDTARAEIVTAATRLWPAGPESQDPVPLLAKLTEQARGRDPRIQWDLRDEVANRRDPNMLDAAVYTGLALSSLNTRTGSFHDACASAKNEMDIPGTILYVCGRPGHLGEVRMLHAERRAAGEHNHITIHSHQALSDYMMSAPYPFAEVGLQALYDLSGCGAVLNWMLALDAALYDADQARLATVPSRRDPRHRPS